MGKAKANASKIKQPKSKLQEMAKGRGKPRKYPKEELMSPYFNDASVAESAPRSSAAKRLVETLSCGGSQSQKDEENFPGQEQREHHRFTDALKDFAATCTALPLESWEAFRVDNRSCCGLCGEVVEGLELLKAHVQKHVFLRCLRCNMSFNQLELFRSHVQLHSSRILKEGTLPISSTALKREKVSRKSLSKKRKLSKESTYALSVVDVVVDTTGANSQKVVQESSIVLGGSSGVVTQTRRSMPDLDSLEDELSMEQLPTAVPPQSPSHSPANLSKPKANLNIEPIGASTLDAKKYSMLVVPSNVEQVRKPKIKKDIHKDSGNGKWPSTGPQHQPRSSTKLPSSAGGKKKRRGGKSKLVQKVNLARRVQDEEPDGEPLTVPEENSIVQVGRSMPVIDLEESDSIEHWLNDNSSQSEPPTGNNVEMGSTSRNPCLVTVNNHPSIISRQPPVCLICNFQSRSVAALCKHNRIYHKMKSCLCHNDCCSNNFKNDVETRDNVTTKLPSDECNPKIDTRSVKAHSYRSDENTQKGAVEVIDIDSESDRPAPKQPSVCSNIMPIICDDSSDSCSVVVHPPQKMPTPLVQVEQRSKPKRGELGIRGNRISRLRKTTAGNDPVEKLNNPVSAVISLADDESCSDNVSSKLDDPKDEPLVEIEERPKSIKLGAKRRASGSAKMCKASTRTSDLDLNDPPAEKRKRNARQSRKTFKKDTNKNISSSSKSCSTGRVSRYELKSLFEGLSMSFGNTEDVSLYGTKVTRNSASSKERSDPSVSVAGIDKKLIVGENRISSCEELSAPSFFSDLGLNDPPAEKRKRNARQSRKTFKKDTNKNKSSSSNSCSTGQVSRYELKSLFEGLSMSFGNTEDVSLYGTKVTRNSASSKERSDLSVSVAGIDKKLIVGENRISSCEELSAPSFLATLHIDKIKTVPSAARLTISVLDHLASEALHIPRTVISGDNCTIFSWPVYLISRSAKSVANDLKWKTLLNQYGASETSQQSKSDENRSVEDTPDELHAESVADFEVVDMTQFSKPVKDENEIRESAMCQDPLFVSREKRPEYIASSGFWGAFSDQSIPINRQDLNVNFDYNTFLTQIPTTPALLLKDVPELVEDDQWIVSHLFYRQLNRLVDKVLVFTNRQSYISHLENEDSPVNVPRSEIVDDYTYLCDFRNTSNIVIVPVKFKGRDNRSISPILIDLNTQMIPTAARILTPDPFLENNCFPIDFTTDYSSVSKSVVSKLLENDATNEENDGIIEPEIDIMHEMWIELMKHVDGEDEKRWENNGKDVETGDTALQELDSMVKEDDLNFVPEKTAGMRDDKTITTDERRSPILVSRTMTEEKPDLNVTPCLYSNSFLNNDNRSVSSVNVKSGYWGVSSSETDEEGFALGTPKVYEIGDARRHFNDTCESTRNESHSPWKRDKEKDSVRANMSTPGPSCSSVNSGLSPRIKGGRFMRSEKRRSCRDKRDSDSRQLRHFYSNQPGMSRRPCLPGDHAAGPVYTSCYASPLHRLNEYPVYADSHSPVRCIENKETLGRFRRTIRAESAVGDEDFSTIDISDGKYCHTDSLSSGSVSPQYMDFARHETRSPLPRASRHPWKRNGSPLFSPYSSSSDDLRSPGYPRCSLPRKGTPLPFSRERRHSSTSSSCISDLIRDQASSPIFSDDYNYY